MKQTAVEWLIEKVNGQSTGLGMYGMNVRIDISADIIQQAKEMEKEAHKKTYYQGLNSDFQDFEQYYSETFGTEEQMTREEKLETIVKLFAKIMFYGDWKWETPNERVITMLMQEVGMYPFKNEDDMISKTPVSDDLYKKAIKEVPSRQAKGWDESVSYKASEE
jgi:hypothetical protein